MGKYRYNRWENTDITDGKNTHNTDGEIQILYMGNRYNRWKIQILNALIQQIQHRTAEAAN